MSEQELIDMVRKLLKDGGKSLNQIAKDAEVDKGALSRIANGKQCTVETAQKICKSFGYRIKIEKKGRAKK